MQEAIILYPYVGKMSTPLNTLDIEELEKGIRREPKESFTRAEERALSKIVKKQESIDAAKQEISDILTRNKLTLSDVQRYQTIMRQRNMGRQTMTGKTGKSIRTLLFGRESDRA